MTNKQKIYLLLALMGVWFTLGANWLMQYGDEGMGFQVYTAGGVILWVAAFVHVMNQIQISEMSPEEYAKYKSRPQPANLM
jgi:predicted membrane channel-forming protein YqfA (hemolysin III family)